MLPVRLAAFSIFAVASFATAQTPIRLRVDLSDAPRHLLHVSELLPAHPGVNAYSYPQWIPGAHLPGGPIDNLTGLVFHAGSAEGPVLPWRRDLVDMYAFHVNAPEGVTSVAVTFDYLDVPSRADTTATNHTSAHVVMLDPSDVVLYPGNTPVRDLRVTPTLHLPANWSAATALWTEGQTAPALHGQDTTFATVSVEQLVDSPIVAGDYCRQYPLAPELQPRHTLDVCTDKAADLDLPPTLLNDMQSLVRQADALFRSHHYGHYDFVGAMSPHLQGDSLEHTQSAEYVVKGLDLANPQMAAFLGYLLPHEFTHAWCGKYCRPAGLATPEYHTPMQDDLLWVYEGLTEYYGDVLATRAGFRTPAQTLDKFTEAIYSVDQPGRLWRSVQDTADASSTLRGVDASWANWRREQDYYREGALIWLEADMKIRALSHGTRSLDDFAAAFFGARPPGETGNTGPGVFPYIFADVVQALNTVAPYDWADFWTTRLNALTAKPPTAGLEAAGYSYVDAATMVPDEAAFMQATHMTEQFHSLGILVLPDGVLRDVWMGSPAFAAGLGPGDKLTAVNGQPYSPEALVKAIRDAQHQPDPIRLTAVRGEDSAVYVITYHGGEKYAGLRRNGNPDVLTTGILAPRLLTPRQ